MSGSIRTVDGVGFRSFRILNPGENFFCVAGGTIMVETWALDWGKHEFDYELNSRGVGPNGRPGAIATTRSALQREFLERRVVTRYPVPVSVGFNGLRRAPEIGLTLGEVKPAVYRSRLPGPKVAWSLAFKSHRHHGGVGGKRASTGRTARDRSPPGSGRAGGLPTGHNYLMIYLPVADLPRAQEYRGGFGVTDVVGTDPSLIERWIARITGR